MYWRLTVKDPTKVWCEPPDSNIVLCPVQTSSKLTRSAKKYQFFPQLISWICIFARLQAIPRFSEDSGCLMVRPDFAVSLGGSK